MAKKIWNPASYESLRPSSTTAPPHVMLSGYYDCGFGYRVLRPRGAGSWLLFYTVAGTGLLRQPGGAWWQTAGNVALLAPDAYSDYGVPFRKGQAAEPLVSAAVASAYARNLPIARHKLKTDPTRRFVRCLHLNPRPHGLRPMAHHGWRFHWIHFQPRAAWDKWLRLDETGKGLYAAHVRWPAARERIMAAFDRIHRDLLTGRSAGEALAASALEEILVVAGLESGEDQRPLDPRISAALARLQGDLAGAHSVATLARSAGLSPSRFAHLFKAQTGAAVSQTVIRLRMLQARRMLVHSQERISDIAYGLGFCSPYYFSQQFKAQTGSSPKAFRRKAAKR